MSRRDAAIERSVSRLLRVGVLIAGAVTALGAVLLLARHGGEVANYRAFNGEPDELRRVGGVFAGAARGHASAIVQLGLILLIATPVSRVLVTFVAFLARRERGYIAITGIVLAVLLFSLFLGGGTVL